MYSYIKNMEKMIHYFYSIKDSKKEHIWQLETDDKEDAVVYFAKLKKLSIDDFLKLYVVKSQLKYEVR